MTSFPAAATTNRTLQRMFIVALVTMAGIIGLALINVSSVRDNNLQRTRSVDSLRLLDALHIALLQGEAAQRALILTGDRNHEQEFVEHARRVEALLASPVPGSGGDASRLQPVLQTAERRLQALQEALEVYRRDGMEEAQALIRTGDGRALMESFREQVIRQQETEMAALVAARQRMERDSQRLLFLLLGWAVVSSLMLWMGRRLLRRESREQERLYTELAARSDDLKLLNDLNHNLMSCSELTEAGQVVQHFLQQLFPEMSGALYLYRSSRNVLELHACWGGTDTFPERLLPEECWGLRRGQIYARPVGNELACPHHAGLAALPSMCLPMMALGDTLGLLQVVGPSSRLGLDSAEGRLLETTVSQIASSIANLNLRAVLRAQSIRDPLTGLYNRRYLEETMPREELRAKRAGQPLSIVVLDVDHFKQFNDTQGHQAGDAVLQAVAVALTSVVRDEDIACRFGGEEFLLILPGLSLALAVERAEQLRHAVARLAVLHGGRPLPAVTASLGVATCPEHGARWQDVLSQADAALYRAKRDGRNRTAAAGGGDQSGVPD